MINVCSLTLNDLQPTSVQSEAVYHLHTHADVKQNTKQHKKQPENQKTKKKQNNRKTCEDTQKTFCQKKKKQQNTH